jgi:topoisomerase-4 subunit A
VVITEIPYQVQKSRLIEKIADLFKDKKLPLLANIRDESADDIRIVLDPKNRSVEAATLMESLYRSTDLEVRISLNMNVLGANGAPKVMSLREVLQEFLNHRHEVLVRRSKYRLGKIDHRLEVLEGFLVAYLNLDEVIRIIREEDEPKAAMMKKWKLSDIQVEAILNMRLRSLRRLEEMEIKTEHKALSDEKKKIQAILKNEELRWQIIGDEIKEIKKKFGKSTAIGKRRTEFVDAPISQVISIESFIEREPVTILCSRMSWIKALKGHIEDLSGVKYKEGDDERFIIRGQTTDKLLVFTSDGKFFTISCNNISGGKGFGEPLNLMVDLAPNTTIIDMFIYQEGVKILVAAKNGKGFVVEAEDVLAQTKNGRQILNISNGVDAVVCASVDGDHVAVIGENRRMVIFPLTEVPVMKRGAGVALQKYKHGGMADLKVFKLEEGLSWISGNKSGVERKLSPWIAKRAHPGKLPPAGFPRNNRFS